MVKKEENLKRIFTAVKILYYKSPKNCKKRKEARLALVLILA